MIADYRDLRTDSPPQHPDREYEEFIVLCTSPKKVEIRIVWPHDRKLQELLPRSAVAWRPLFDDEPRLVDALNPAVQVLYPPVTISIWSLQRNGVKLDVGLAEIKYSQKFTSQSDFPIEHLASVAQEALDGMPSFIAEVEKYFEEES